MSATYPESLLDAVAALRSGSISANELALQTLERYKDKLDDATSALTALEIEDVVTVHDVAAVRAA